MEKRRKDKECQETKFFRKKSKIQLGTCLSRDRLTQKDKEALEQTKQSFTAKPVLKKSVSIGKKHKETLMKASSVTALHPKPIINTRYLTEALSTKQSKDGQKKLIKSGMISPERKTFHDSFARSTKDRLSLNDPTKMKNPESSSTKVVSTNCEEISIKELTGARKDIQEAIKRTCQKNSISKKQFLKITNQYQKLISRIIFSEIVDSDNRAQAFSSETQENQNSLTFRVEEMPKTKPNCPGLSLQGIKKMGIQDYQDQFMAHYDELSESWKRDLAVQRRF